MCEPMHSIVQFPDQDDNSNPTGPMLDTIPTTDSFWERFKKKIKSWYHFSKLGFGHSESLEFMPSKMRVRMPQETKYESAWWIRQVKIDGRYHGVHQFEAPEALEAATIYAQKTSIGNLTLVRQFLTMSMKKSDSPFRYLESFVQMLNKKGADLYAEKIRRVLKVSSVHSMSLYRGANVNLEIAIKLMMGFTRKRDLLVPEWADDCTLWVPSTPLVHGV